MRLLGGSTSAPSMMVLMGLLLMSTVSHFCQRELQPSICAVSQLECCCSKRSMGMRLLGESMSAPSEMVLRGQLLLSTVSHYLSKRAAAQHLCCLSVGVLVPCFLISTGQLHTYQVVHQHAATLWQCWLCRSDPELIHSSSCTRSISIPDRRNVIVLSPNQDSHYVSRCILPTHMWLEGR